MTQTYDPYPSDAYHRRPAQPTTQPQKWAYRVAKLTGKLAEWVIIAGSFAMVFGCGVYLGSLRHAHDYAQGVDMGRQEILDNQSADMAMLKHKDGLCAYADLACGYYHNPAPAHNKRP